MKIKQQPEDFQVEELTDVAAGNSGDFALYRLEKRGWSTPDAVQAIRRRWKLDRRRVSYGGLKDRHAHTIQFLTILHGPKRKLTHHDVELEYLGQVGKAFTSQDIRGNRFRLTLRALSETEVDKARQALAELASDGLPNYFDDQRFGSVTAEGAPEFMARSLVRGEFELALRQALTAPYEHDRADARKEKSLLRKHWGEWQTLMERLPRGHARSLVDYLRQHATDFKGALARLRPDLRGLYLSAYQSYLWNRMLASWLSGHCRPEQLLQVPLKLAAVPMPRGLEDAQRAELAGLSLPLPTARLHLEADDARLPLIQSVLAEEGLELRQLQVKGIRELFFSKGERAAWFLPAALTHEVDSDDANPGRHRLTMAFELPRGCYATLLVKRIQNAERA